MKQKLINEDHKVRLAGISHYCLSEPMSQLNETIDNQGIDLAQVAMSLEEPNDRLKNQRGCLNLARNATELEQQDIEVAQSS